MAWAMVGSRQARLAGVVVVVCGRRTQARAMSKPPQPLRGLATDCLSRSPAPYPLPSLHHQALGSSLAASTPHAEESQTPLLYRHFPRSISHFVHLNQLNLAKKRWRQLQLPSPPTRRPSSKQSPVTTGTTIKNSKYAAHARVLAGSLIIEALGWLAYNPHNCPARESR